MINQQLNLTFLFLINNRSSFLIFAFDIIFFINFFTLPNTMNKTLINSDVHYMGNWVHSLKTNS